MPLRFISDDLPSLVDVPIEPLLSTFYGQSDRDPRRNIFGFDAVPESFVALGVASVTFDRAEPCTPLSGWNRFPFEVWKQRRWDATPELARTAYLLARDVWQPVVLPSFCAASSKADLRVCADMVHVSFGVRDEHDVDDRSIVVTDPGSFDWRILDTFPCIYKLRVLGDQPGLCDWLRARPLISYLIWRGARGRIDLRGTGLERLELELPGGEVELLLPDDLERLELDSEACSKVRVTHDGDGAGMSLYLQTWEGAALDRLEGLARVAAVYVMGFGSLDAAKISARWNPAQLQLHGAPGVLHNSAALGALDAMKEVLIMRCVSIDAEHFPSLSSWPRLTSMRLLDLAVSEADTLRARLGDDRRLTVDTRDATWIAAHVGVPMLRWPLSFKSLGAVEVFAQAATSLASATSASEMQVALRVFIDGINELHADPVTRLSVDDARDVDAAWAMLLARVESGGAGEVVDRAHFDWRPVPALHGLRRGRDRR